MTAETFQIQMFTNARIIGPIPANAAEYHTPTAQRGAREFVMSSGALREFAACPERWRQGYQSPDSDARTWGSLIDCLLTTPKQFESIYAIAPDTYITKALTCPKCDSVSGSAACRKCKRARVEIVVSKDWNNNATECKTWAAARKAEGREIVSARLVADARAAIGRLNHDEIIAAWLAACDCQVWVAGEWHDEPTGLQIPVKALLDFRPRPGTEFAKCLGDFKTTRNAAAMPWQRWCFTAGYHIQAAFYMDLYTAATGEDRNTWCFIVQENYAPWQPGKRMLAQDFLTLGRAQYRQMLGNYCQCLARDRWPGYDDTDEAVQGWTLVAPEPFMAERAAFAPRYEFEEESTEAAPVALNELEVVP